MRQVEAFLRAACNSPFIFVLVGEHFLICEHSFRHDANPYPYPVSLLFTNRMITIVCYPASTVDTEDEQITSSAPDWIGRVICGQIAVMCCCNNAFYSLSYSVVPFAK